MAASIMSLENQLGIRFKAAITPRYYQILTPEALSFIVDLQRNFNTKRKDILRKRIERQHEIDSGIMPCFLPHTKVIRESEWTIDPVPSDLIDRRVEITGPVERKMIINALNSGAKVFMADFEDSNSPTWSNVMDGQTNLRDAVNKTLTFQNAENGKFYELNKETATLMVRPRGWHLVDKHLLIDGEEVSASLLDFGLYFFHNAHTLIERGTAPYFYLPKLENPS